MNIDMHFHSELSDGDSSIDEILKYGKNKGLKYMFLTDHDKISDEFNKISKQYGIKSAKSVEITAINKEFDKILHITYYSKNISTNLRKIIEKTRLKKSKIVYEQIDKLNNFGFNIDIDDFHKFIIDSGRKKSGINKFDIAKYLYYKNMTPESLNTEIFYSKYLKKGGEFFSKYGIQEFNYEVDIKDLKKEIKENKGILSIAHPNFTHKNSIETFVNTIKSYINNGGINAVEINSKADEVWVKKIIEIAKQYSLYITFGSDCHRLGKNDNRHENIGVKNPYISDDFIQNEFLKYKDILGI